MKKKYLVLMLLSYVICFSLLISLFGPEGYLALRGLKSEYEAIQRKSEQNEVLIASLEARKADAESESSMNSVAISLGYNREGDKVFYFEEPDILDEKISETETKEDKSSFKGVRTYILALWSLSAPLLVAVISILIKRKPKDKTEIKEEEIPYDF